MPIRRIGWTLAASIVIACVSWAAVPADASWQNYENTGHVADCTRIMQTETEALKNDQWERLVAVARQNISMCHDLFRGDDEAGILADIAIGLNMQGKFEDSLPISMRCVTIKPDAAFCYENLGEALEGLGRPADARKAYEQAISIGGYDRVNASAIGLARKLLANLPPEDAKNSEPSVEIKRFGTGFVVSAQGHILTNDHVVAGCKTLATRDGKLLEVLNRNADSDLALLRRPDWLQETQKLAGILDLAPRLTDENRRSIWKAYYETNTKDEFVSMLNKFNLNDDEKQSIYDLRFRSRHDESTNAPVAVFRTGPAPKLGDAVVAFGFPLPGLLSSEGNVSSGILSANSGLGNDVRFIQISAPVQPGNSGGPLFDSSGHVIGVVVAKLDALKIAQITGDIPQNVNFAVQWSVVRAFLDEAGVPYQKEISQRASTTSSTAAAASRIAVAIECTP
jgi:S1-C subfamily serine protease